MTSPEARGRWSPNLDTTPGGTWPPFAAVAEAERERLRDMMSRAPFELLFRATLAINGDTAVVSGFTWVASGSRSRVVNLASDFTAGEMAIHTHAGLPFVPSDADLEAANANAVYGVGTGILADDASTVLVIRKPEPKSRVVLAQALGPWAFVATRRVR